MLSRTVGHRRKRVTAWLPFAAGALFFAPQARAADAPASLSSWGLHCWCLTARHTPQRIVREDENGRILRLLQNGMTRAELATMFPGVKESQLALLRLMAWLLGMATPIGPPFPFCHRIRSCPFVSGRTNRVPRLFVASERRRHHRFVGALTGAPRKRLRHGVRLRARWRFLASSQGAQRLARHRA
jgi:hypothetical protein